MTPMTQWWLFFGELFCLIPTVVDGSVVHTENKWYRWGIIKMITPSEYNAEYIRLHPPANER